MSNTTFLTPSGLSAPLPVPFGFEHLATPGNSFVVEEEGHLLVLALYDPSSQTGAILARNLTAPGGRVVEQWNLTQPIARGHFWIGVLPGYLSMRGLSADRLRRAWEKWDEDEKVGRVENSG